MIKIMHTIEVEEGERQLVLLALAKLALLRPGFDYALRKIAMKFEQPSEGLYEEFKGGSLGGTSLPELSMEERTALLRFVECCEDGQGYDVPKAMMKQLARKGALNHLSAGIYEMSEAGEAMLDISAYQLQWGRSTLPN